MLTFDLELALKLLAIISIFIGAVKYFSNLSNSIKEIAKDIRELKDQQKKQWQRIDDSKKEIQVEREKRIKIESDMFHHNESIKALRDTQRFKLLKQQEEDSE
jgi:ABC-type siderophore export system fused ATPase/permease subunit